MIIMENKINNKMTRSFTKKITREDLAKKIIDVYKTQYDYEDTREYVLKSYNYDLADESNLVFAVENEHSRINFNSLTDRITRDLSKVNFDNENMDANPKYAPEIINGGKYCLKNYVGLHTLDNGLTFLGVTAGGDWESPIFFILYSDGKDLRGYIPKKGNTWNPINKSAFGNDERADELGFKLRGFSSYEDLDFDFKKIEGDILGRISYRPRGELP